MRGPNSNGRRDDSSSCLINGKQNSTAKHYTRENPTHPEETVCIAPVNTKEEAIQAIEAAYEAFQSWKESKLEDRIKRMRRAIDKIKEKLPEICQKP
ncbi:hypothetical protein DCC85_10350 [Paenibacillus sp. CAA11]|nr:hypothetical protein DCC85_10350 [Paenibacillus sp. CAA11]